MRYRLGSPRQRHYDRGGPSRAIQHSQESLRGLAKRYGINPKTVAKWHKRSSMTDLPTGPREPRSTVLTPAEEAIIVAFRRHTLLPLDDCLYALQATIPALTRSALHRCLQRHAISRLPETDGDKPHLFVAIDRTSKFAFAQLHERATTRVAADFPHALLKAVPYRIHTVPTDNGIHFTTPGNIASAASLIREAMDRGEIFRAHAFEYACAQNHIEHRLTKPYHPWTTDEVEQSRSRELMLLSCCPRVTARRRAGHGVQVRPRSLHSRSSFAAPVGTFDPRRVQPSVWRR